MVIDESELTKGQLRKLNALRRSVGDDLAEDVFAKWLARQAAPQTKDKADPIAVKIIEALSGFEDDPEFKLGNRGYTLRRAKGKGASGFIVSKNEKVKPTALLARRSTPSASMIVGHRLLQKDHETT